MSNRKSSDILDRIIHNFFDLRTQGFQDLSKKKFKDASLNFAEAVVQARELVKGMLAVQGKKDIEELKLTIHILSWYIMISDTLTQAYLAKAASAKADKEAVLYLGKACGVSENLYHLCHILDKTLDLVPLDEKHNDTVETARMSISLWAKTLNVVVTLLRKNGLSIPSGLLELAEKEGLLEYNSDDEKQDLGFLNDSMNERSNRT